MDEIYEITNFVQEEAGFGTDLIWGNSTDETLKENICVTVIATGFEGKRLKDHLSSNDALRQEKKKERISLEGYDDTGSKTTDRSATQRQPELWPDEEDDMSRSGIEKVTADEDGFSVRNETTSDQDLSERRPRRKASTHRERPPVDELKSLDSERIQTYEREPAYKRRKVVLEHIDDKRSQSSRYSIPDEDQPALRRDNSFLHDNVD